MKKEKTQEEALNIHNGIKIITSKDSTFEHWNGVISRHSQGKLYDLETISLEKFKENKS